MKYDKNQMLLGRNTSAKNQKLVGKEGNGSTIMGNERRRGMMVKKKEGEVGKTQRRVTVDKYGQKRTEGELKGGIEGEKRRVKEGQVCT